MTAYLLALCAGVAFGLILALRKTQSELKAALHEIKSQKETISAMAAQLEIEKETNEILIKTRCTEKMNEGAE